MRKLKILYLLLPFLSGCWDLPIDMSIPQWDTDFNLPLTHKNYTLEDLIKTDKYISLDDSFLYTASHSDTSDPREVGEFIEGQMDQKSNSLEIPISNNYGEIGVPFTNGMSLDSATFIQGELNLTVYNSSGAPIEVLMVLPALESASGETLAISGTIAAGNQEIFTQDLSNFTYNVTRQKYGSDSLQINGTINGGDAGEKLKIDYEIVNSTFSYIAGKIPPTDIEPINNGVSLPITDDVRKLNDKIKFYSAAIIVRAFYNDKLPASDPNKQFKIRASTMKIAGYRNNFTESIYLKLNGREDENLGPIDIVNGYFESSYTNENSNLSDFMSFMPDTIIVEIQPTINPDFERGAATNKDEITFGFELLIQSIASIKELTYSDTLDFEMDSDVRKNIRDFKAATIFNKIDNHIGFGGDIIMQFADANHSPLFTLEKFSFDPAEVDVEGNPSTKHSEPTVVLDSAQVQQLSNASYVMMDIVINTDRSEQDQKVRFSSKDWIEIISFCTVKYHLNLDK